jgi:hypothetical protein
MVETLIALAITLVISGTVFALLDPTPAQFAVQQEASDMQQRLRVAEDFLYKGLLAAGAGPFITDGPSGIGPLTFSFAPVLPFRPGIDPPGSYKSDAVTVRYVPAGAAHTTLAADAPASATTVSVRAEPSCVAGQSLCDFASGASVLVFDDAGRVAVRSVALVDDANAQLTFTQPLAAAYAAGARVVEAVERTYFLKTDVVNGLYQLMTADGSTGAIAPAVDHVVGLTFDYYGDPQPPSLVNALTGPAGPWTTYGPKPPLSGVASGTNYPPGENCVFMLQSGVPAPRLAALDDSGNSGALVPLTASQLTDGPWCPDPSSPDRWDADLLRVRRIGVTVRVEAAADALRGPASVLFSHAGISRSAGRWLPDRQIRFQVAPRNLNLER